MKYKITVAALSCAVVLALPASTATARLIPPRPKLPSIAVEIPLTCTDNQGVLVVHYNIYEVQGNTRTPIQDRGYVKAQLLYTDASGGEMVRRVTPSVRVLYNDGKRKAVSSEVGIGGACE